MTDKRVKIIKHNKIPVKFEVDSRYSPLESIGTGTYGVVCAAKDNRTGQRVAIKKIPKVFEVSVIAKRTYRELKILRHFRHENIISILDVMQPPEELSQFEDVYVVLDLMESDLHHIIHSIQPLSDEHIKFFLYQVLRGLKYIHSASVLHRDLKPSNLLVNRNCELKIGDFGMARGLASSPDEHASFMTEYVATRWYRAPELMLSFSEYTFAIDIWSVGCIFAEMLARRQLFPGKDYLNQLQLILSVVGTPNADYIDGVGSERVKTYLKNLPSRTHMDLSVLFPSCNQVALELLDKMIQLDPKKRITAEEALGHKYLTRYHDPKDEPVCMPPFNFSFEKELVSQEDLHKAVVEEIMNYHKTRTPIPSQDRVKDALKKMMEDREKEREKVEKEIVENGGMTTVKEPKEVKGAPPAGRPKKAKGGKKRSKQQTQQGNMAEPKRPKLEDEGDQGLTGKDKNTLMKWKQFQKETRPFIHPVRKLMKVGRESDGLVAPVHELQQQQELIIKQQSVRIEKLQRELQEIQRSTSLQISLLKDRHKTIVLKCQIAGVTLPQDLVSDSTSPGPNMNHSSSSSFVVVSSRQAPSSSQHIISQSKPVLLQQQQQRQAQLAPPPPPLSSSSSLSTNSSFSTSTSSSITPPTSFSSAMGELPSYSNSSPTNQIHSSSSHVPQSRGPPPPLLSAHLHRPVVSIVPLSSTCSLDSVRNTQQINPQHMLTGGGGGGGGGGGSARGRTPPQHHQFLGIGASQIVPARMMLGDHPRHMQSQVDPLPSRPHTFLSGKNISPGTGPMLLDDLSFSPLTSGELNDLDNPSGMGGIFLSPSLMPLTDDLDSILNITMPSGSGAGYGVGVKEEELSREPLVLDLNDLGPTTSGPPSASLLHDWLDVSQLDPDDMDSLQRELETGAPDMFNIHDFHL